MSSEIEGKSSPLEKVPYRGICGDCFGEFELFLNPNPPTNILAMGEDHYLIGLHKDEQGGKCEGSNSQPIKIVGVEHDEDDDDSVATGMTPANDN